MGYSFNQDLNTMHEKADVIILHEVIALASFGCDRIKVIRNDTDVFVRAVSALRCSEKSDHNSSDGAHVSRTLVS